MVGDLKSINYSNSWLAHHPSWQREVKGVTRNDRLLKRDRHVCPITTLHLIWFSRNHPALVALPFPIHILNTIKIQFQSAINIILSEKARSSRKENKQKRKGLNMDANALTLATNLLDRFLRGWVQLTITELHLLSL